MSSSPAGEQLGHCLRGMFFLPPPPSAGSQRGHMAPEHPCPCHPRPPFTPSTAGGIGLVPLSAAWPLSSSDHELPTASRASLGHYCVLDLAQCLAQVPLRRERVNGIWAFGPGGAAPPGAGFCVPCWGQIAASEFQPGVPLGGRFSSLAPSRQDVEEATRGATDNSPWGPREQTVLRQPRGRPALCAGTRAINRRHISGRLFGAKRHAPTPPGPRTLPYRAVAERPARGGPGANYG